MDIQIHPNKIRHSRVLVVAYPGASASATPPNGLSLTANSTYGSGSYVGNGYVVYSGRDRTMNNQPFFIAPVIEGYGNMCVYSPYK